MHLFMSYLPCVYFELARRSGFKLQREREGLEIFPMNPHPPRTQGTQMPLKSSDESIKSILLMCWAKSYPPSSAAGHLSCKQDVFTERRSQPFKIRRVHSISKVLLLVSEGDVITALHTTSEIHF